MKSSYTIPAAIIFGGIVIAAALYMSMPKKAPTPDSVNPSLVRPVSASDHIFGNPAAPVMIITYTDFDCVPCQGFHDTLHHIIANEGATGQVAWVFRHFPLTEVHPNPFALARAAECAAATAGSDPVASNNAFWKFSDALFLRQPVDPSALGTIASAAGISGSAFATCYADASPAIDSRISADRENALLMGAVGTPFSIILTNGKNPGVVDAAYPYDILKQIVTKALSD
jgi:protein-disulfide isomerase